MVSKLLKGRGLGLQGSCKSFPTVYSQLCRYVDCGEMTYNYYMHKGMRVSAINNTKSILISSRLDESLYLDFLCQEDLMFHLQPPQLCL